MHRWNDGEPHVATTAAVRAVDDDEVTRAELVRQLDAARGITHALVAQSPIGVALFDRQLRCVEINETLARLIGISDERRAGRAAEDVLGAPGLRAAIPPLRRAVSTGEPITSLRVGFSHPAGSVVHAIHHAIPIRSGERVIGVASMMVDVTPLHCASEARRKSEQALAAVGEITRALTEPGSLETMLARFARAVVEHLADVCSVHLRGAASHVRCVAAADSSVEGPITRSFADLLRDDDAAPPEHGLLHVLRTGSADVVAEVDPELLESLAKDAPSARTLAALGTRSWIVAPLLTQSVVRGAIVLEHRRRSYEATDRAIVEELARRVSAALESAMLLEEAQRANQLKDEFLSVASHELRTPLSTILGWSKLLRDDPSPNMDRVKKGLEVVPRNATAQARLVDDILDTSRILRNKVTLDLKTVAIGVPVEEAIESLRGAAAERGLELAVEIDPDAIGKADTTRLRQISYSLISNALKFTPRGGRVSVRVAREPGGIVIQVRDTGAGIDPAYVPYLFERFRQADASPTRKHGGLGLGLAIASKLVALHGGAITAESEGLGRGATFTVRLPGGLRASEPGTSPGVSVAPRARTADLGGVRVLLVDDHDDARDLYGSVLSLRGARVTAARSAAEARALLASARYDVLVSDIAMPGEDGRSLAKFARSHDLAMRRVAISAFSQPDDLSLALEAGFERYLVKPIDTGDLVGTVAELAAPGRTSSP